MRYLRGPDRLDAWVAPAGPVYLVTAARASAMPWP
jgi:hypothetical protein